MLSFGFIGCGKAAGFHADVILALQHSITGVSARAGSKNIDNFSKSYSVANVYYDWRQMIERQKPDALIVATTWDKTQDIIQEVISCGIPTLVEKPVALDSSTLERIIISTKKFHDRVMVGYNRRFYDFIPVIKQALAEKELVSVDLNFPEPLEALINQKSLRIADHILVYLSSHWLDLLMFLIGDLKVEWMSKKLNRQHGYVEAYNGILKSIKYDVPIHLKANFNSPSNTSILFNFNDSIYSLCPIEALNIYSGMDLIKPPDAGPISRYIPKIKDSLYTDAKYKPGFFNQIKYFIEACIEKKKPNAQGCTLQEALAVTRVCEQIQKS